MSVQVSVKDRALTEFRQAYFEMNRIWLKLRAVSAHIERELQSVTHFPHPLTNGRGVELYKNENYLFVVKLENDRILDQVKHIKGVRTKEDIRFVLKKYPKYGTALVQQHLDMSNVYFSYHALERFIERFRPDLSIDEAKGIAHELLSRATPSNISPARRVQKIINNGYEEAQYFTNGNCRFVVVNNDDRYLNVVTIEPS